MGKADCHRKHDPRRTKASNPSLCLVSYFWLRHEGVIPNRRSTYLCTTPLPTYQPTHLPIYHHAATRLSQCQTCRSNKLVTVDNSSLRRAPHSGRHFLATNLSRWPIRHCARDLVAVTSSSRGQTRRCQDTLPTVKLPLNKAGKFPPQMLGKKTGNSDRSHCRLDPRSRR